MFEQGFESSAKPVPKLSSRGGTFVLRSLSLFLVGGKRKTGKSVHVSAANSPNITIATSSTTAGIGNSRSKKCNFRRKMSMNKTMMALFEAIRKETHFTKEEFEAIYQIYKKLAANSKTNMIYINTANIGHATAITKPNTFQDGIDRVVFQELMHNTFDLVIEDMLMDRIFCAWDKNNEGLLNAEMFINGLSAFLRGTFQKKIQYCFRVYDLNSDGYITKDEMFQLLKNCLVKQPQEEDPDEGVKDLVEIVLRKLDVDRDGKVSFQDYETAVRNEPLLLEAFGQCLPTEGACSTFLSTLHT